MTLKQILNLNIVKSDKPSQKDNLLYSNGTKIIWFHEKTENKVKQNRMSRRAKRVKNHPKKKNPVIIVNDLFEWLMFKKFQEIRMVSLEQKGKKIVITYETQKPQKS